MNDTDAGRLALMLLTAFKSPKVEQRDVELWTHYLSELQDTALAGEVVDGLIRDEERRPPIARLLKGYATARRRKAEALAHERGLVEPEPLSGREGAVAVLAALPGEGGGWFAAEARSFFRSIAGLPPGEPGDRAADDDEPELEQLNPGPCNDCFREVPSRFSYGRRRLCHECFGRRQKVAAELEPSPPGGDR
jgi:hypothetical protein